MSEEHILIILIQNMATLPIKYYLQIKISKISKISKIVNFALT